VALRIVEEGDVVLVENSEEFVPRDAMEPIVVIAAGLIVIDPKEPAVTAFLSFSRGGKRVPEVIRLNVTAVGTVVVPVRCCRG
jgi:hypothetical protein